MSLLFLPILFLIILLGLGVIAFAVLTPILLRNGKSRTPFQIVWFILLGLSVLHIAFSRYDLVFARLSFFIHPAVGAGMLLISAAMLIVTYTVKPKHKGTENEFYKMKIQDLK